MTLNAEPPRGPGWNLFEEKLLATGTTEFERPGRPPVWSPQLRIRPQHFKLLRVAARNRGINLSGYCWRAIMAFVAHDLRLDWKAVAVEEPGTWNYDQTSSRRSYKAGDGYGEWTIGDLR